MSREVETRMRVPQMLGLDALTRIIVAYLKAGADKREVIYGDVSQIANVATANVQRNAPFFAYLGLLEGGRGKYKLTDAGKVYSQALDWGRIKDASSTLKNLIRDNELISRILGYVDINRPVAREDLISRIALIAGVDNVSRYRTGINGLVDMLVSSNLLNEDDQGNLNPAELPVIEEELIPIIPEKPQIEVSQVGVPISVTINLDADKIDTESLKKLLKVIKEALTETA